MIRLLIVLSVVFVGLGVALSSQVGAQSDATASPSAPKTSMLYIESPYALATTSVQKNGAAFFRVTNQGANPEKIISASSPIAERVELHTHSMDGDVMMMRQVESFEIAPNTTHALNPMGDHVMLFGLKQKLNAGESFPITLVTADDVELNLDVSIKNPADAPVMEHSDMHHNHEHDEMKKDSE